MPSIRTMDPTSTDWREAWEAPLDHKKVTMAADSETSAWDLPQEKTFNSPLAASQITSWPQAQKA